MSDILIVTAVCSTGACAVIAAYRIAYHFLFRDEEEQDNIVLNMTTFKFRK